LEIKEYLEAQPFILRYVFRMREHHGVVHRLGAIIQVLLQGSALILRLHSSARI
jgi:hypothetical protein